MSAETVSFLVIGYFAVSFSAMATVKAVKLAKEHKPGAYLFLPTIVNALLLLALGLEILKNGGYKFLLLAFIWGAGVFPLWIRMTLRDIMEKKRFGYFK